MTQRTKTRVTNGSSEDVLCFYILKHLRSLVTETHAVYVQINVSQINATHMLTFTLHVGSTVDWSLFLLVTVCSC